MVESKIQPSAVKYQCYFLLSFCAWLRLTPRWPVTRHTAFNTIPPPQAIPLHRTVFTHLLFTLPLPRRREGNRIVSIMSISYVPTEALLIEFLIKFSGKKKPTLPLRQSLLVSNGYVFLSEILRNTCALIPSMCVDNLTF